MLTLIVVAALAVALGALIWWGTSFAPTRPRAGSRSRGEPYVSVHRRLQRRR